MISSKQCHLDNNKLAYVIMIVIILVLLGGLIFFVCFWKKKQIPKYFLTLVCKIRNEQKILKEFIPYYLSQGVDKIYLLDDSSTEPYDRSITSNPNITFISVTKARESGDIKADVRAFYPKLRNTEWLIVVDADEFITTRLNKDHTIRDELETTFKEADCIQIPWIMFGSSGHRTTPKSILKSCVYRWNQDKKHPHSHNSSNNKCRYEKIEVKSIFRPKKFKSLNNHHPENPVTDNINVVDGVHNQPSKLQTFHFNLREKDITTAIFTCNHYRYISREYMRQKCDVKTIHSSYQTKNCFRDLLTADYNEVLDRILADKS